MAERNTGTTQQVEKSNAIYLFSIGCNLSYFTGISLYWIRAVLYKAELYVIWYKQIKNTGALSSQAFETRITNLKNIVAYQKRTF